MAELKPGSKVKIVRSLGPANYSNPGSASQYYYPNTGDVRVIPLGTEGTLDAISGNEAYILIGGSSYVFHEGEYEILPGPGNTPNIEIPAKIPMPYAFSLASKSPVLLLEDRLYTIGEPSNSPGSDFFEDQDGTKKPLVESAALTALERLLVMHHPEHFEKFKEAYIEQLGEQQVNVNTSEKFFMLNFIVNEVFPYLRGRKEIDVDDVAKVLGADVKEKPAEEGQKQVSRPYDKYIIDLIKGILLEEYQKPGKPAKKIDLLLGAGPEFEFDAFAEDYAPVSITGRILKGRNVAIMDGNVYKLVEGDSKPEVRFGGKAYSLTWIGSVKELKNRFDFQIGKALRIHALQELADERAIKAIEQAQFFEVLKDKQEYEEEDFGFIVNGGNYTVFLKVPPHVLKDHDGDSYNYYSTKGAYYAFEGGKIGVTLSPYMNGASRTMTYSPSIKPIGHFLSPFIRDPNNGYVCMGGYRYDSLKSLPAGQAVAKMLQDGRRTILSGYTPGVAPEIRLSSSTFSSRRITIEEANRKGIPVTNENLRRGSDPNGRRYTG